MRFEFDDIAVAGGTVYQFVDASRGSGFIATAADSVIAHYSGAVDPISFQVDGLPSIHDCVGVWNQSPGVPKYFGQVCGVDSILHGALPHNSPLNLKWESPYHRSNGVEYYYFTMNPTPPSQIVGDLSFKALYLDMPGLLNLFATAGAIDASSAGMLATQWTTKVDVFLDVDSGHPDFIKAANGVEHWIGQVGDALGDNDYAKYFDAQSLATLKYAVCRAPDDANFDNLMAFYLSEEQSLGNTTATSNCP